jgi:SAM-dependent methyltransferase
VTSVGEPPAATRWRDALERWGIPQHILDAAPSNPWVHPVAMFAARGDDPDDTPSMLAVATALDDIGGRGVVLDVGCGGGRSSLPLAGRLRAVVGVDQQPAMLDQFTDAAAERGIPCTTIQGRWPDAAAGAPVTDVAVCHHVAYNVGDIVPFLEALERHARTAVVVELTARHPQHPLNAAWQHFWSVTRPDEPSADLFAAVVRELGREPTLVRWRRAERRAPVPDAELVAHVRQRLCLAADRDPEIAEFLGANPRLASDEVCTVSWRP